MGLLTDMQVDLLDDTKSIGPILLKLRFLASRLGSHVLEDWVRFETEGYPADHEVPAYRVAELRFSGTFENMVRVLNDVPIPSYLVVKYAGERWGSYSIRDNLSTIEDMLADDKKSATFGIDASNLPLLLQNHVYPDHACIMVRAILDRGTFKRIQSTVRAKVLDLTLELEKNVPAASEVVVGGSPPEVAAAVAEKVTQMTQQIFYGPVVLNSGQAGNISVNVTQGNVESLIGALVSKGVPEADAKELAEIVKAEVPDDTQQPIGKRAREWLAGKLRGAGGALWGMGKEAATALLTEAAKQYYGLS